jgi:hypothetical protein
VFGTYDYIPKEGWSKASIGMLVEACPISEDAKENIYNHLVDRLICDTNQS